MKCVYCGAEMKQGTVRIDGDAGHPPYISYLADSEKEKKGIRGFFQRKEILLNNFDDIEVTAWRCLFCKKIMLFLNEQTEY